MENLEATTQSTGKRIALLLVLVMLFSLVAVGCGQPAQEQQQTDNPPAGGEEQQAEGKELKYDWILGGSTPGHTLYQIAVAYAKILQQVPGFTATVENSGGGYDGIDLTMAKDMDSAGAGLIAVLAKYKGTGRYEGKADDCIRSFIPTYTAPVQIIVLENSPIQTLNDLRGKRVGTMPITAGNYTVNQTVFQAAGFKEGDLIEVQIEIVEMVDGLTNGTIDAAMITTGAPTAAIMELKATHPIRFIPIELEVAEKAAALNASVFSGVITAGTYEGQDEDIPTVVTYSVMMTRSDLPEDVVYEAIKAIWENQDVFKNTHASQKGFSSKWFVDVDKAVPFHDGVKKFAEEMGWK